MQISSRFKNYSVDFIESFTLLFELADKEDTFFVFDKIVYELYKNNFPQIEKDRFFLIDALEENKTISTVLEICEKMTEMTTKRNTHLVSVGGGIVQDITGFVATSLYRGIRWTFLPSTLLAACDSCIGGKSSLNYKRYKNLLGSFYPPDTILIYPPFFNTLTDRDYCSGLGEVVKFNIIAGKEKVDEVCNNIDYLLNRKYDLLKKYVLTSLEFKKLFIEEDEFDKGRRILLNYAHTFGHAYEVVSDYKIPHGSAVALGMMTANNISLQRGYIAAEYVEKTTALCKKILRYIDLDKNDFKLDNIISAIKKDKKQTSEAITAVLIAEDYSLKVYKDIKIAEIKQAVENMLEQFAD